MQADLDYNLALLEWIGKADPVLVDKVMREYMAEIDGTKQLQTQISGDNHINWSEKPTKATKTCGCTICD